jgi:hypothetical protein
MDSFSLTRVAEEMQLRVPQLNAARPSTTVCLQVLPVAMDNILLTEVVKEMQARAPQLNAARTIMVV